MKYHVEFDLELNKNPYRGLFIALEGVDASGKSTQVKLIKDQFEKDGKTLTIKHPFEGQIGEFIRKILSGQLDIPTTALQYLISANRHVQQQEIVGLLNSGENVLIDRYVFSALAYGMFDKGIDHEEAKNLLLIEQSILSMYHQFLMPDINFYLKLSPEIAYERLNNMDKEKEIYEDEEKIKKISQIYEMIIKDFKNEFVVIDAQESIEDVTANIMKHIRSTSKY